MGRPTHGHGRRWRAPRSGFPWQQRTLGGRARRDPAVPLIGLCQRRYASQHWLPPQRLPPQLRAGCPEASRCFTGRGEQTPAWGCPECCCLPSPPLGPAPEAARPLPLTGAVPSLPPRWRGQARAVGPVDACTLSVSLTSPTARFCS